MYRIKTFCLSVIERYVHSIFKTLLSFLYDLGRRFCLRCFHLLSFAFICFVLHDQNGWTALHWACHHEDKHLALALIEKGAGLEKADNVRCR